MAFISKEEFTSHIDEEIINLISRDDVNIVTEALEAGVQVASGYLSRFDVDAIFATIGTDRLIYTALMIYIKDIAKWLFIRKVNPNIDLSLAKTAYDEAIKELGKMQAGKLTPNGWPLAIQPENKVGQFSVTSRPKRGNYY
ncbi:MAG: hypothetical protein ABIN95_02065 [Mucilaginibacter sp.]